MFTGIITDIGTLQSISELDKGKRFRVTSSIDPVTIEIGSSIAHQGVCLSVVAKGVSNGANWHEVEAWEETLRLSTLGSWKPGQKINLERSLKIGDELGGHLVFGHVDGVVKIVEVKDEGGAKRFVVEAPQTLAKFIAQKGSVALDGTSLTVNKVEGNRFDVLLIAHTLQVTSWGSVKKGDLLNIEVDQMARYVARILDPGLKLDG